MATTLRLDDIKAEMERKYGPLVIDLGHRQVHLLSALRLPDTRRKALAGIQDQLAAAQEANDADQMLPLMRQLVGEVCGDDEQADALLEAVAGDDELAMLATVLKQYQEHSQPGEAESSPS